MKLIKISGSVLVNQNLKTVFDFFANPQNDPTWRSEINQSTINGTLRLGVTILEYSFLSKKVPNNLIEFRCVQLESNKIAVFETLDNARFYLRSERKVVGVSSHITAINYVLSFDKELVRFALGFCLPQFIISMKAKSDMKKYLRQLKANLESQ